MTEPARTRLSVREACDRILAAIAPLGAERVDLADALGRVLAEPVTSPVSLPPWDNSAMDGFACRAADVVGASVDSAVVLLVVETIAAGGFPTRALGAGEAARIMTGAPIPPSADTVIRVEDTDDGDPAVRIHDARDTGRNVRPAGEDVRAGDVVLASGSAIGPAQLGVLASVGAAVVSVHRRPRVAILGSGDELVELDRFDEVRAGRRIVSSNGWTLPALVRQAGGEPVPLGTVPDDPAALRARLEQARGCDLLLTSAGVSVGAHDHTRPVLEAMGAALDFWRIRIRPGAPLAFGTLGAMPWIGLPGNPVSAMVTFELFVRPALRRMQGLRALFRRAVPVVALEPIETAARLTHYFRGTVMPDDTGRLVARLTGPQGSGLLTSMARANALLVLPEQRPRVAAGETLDAILLGEDALMTTEPTP